MVNKYQRPGIYTISLLLEDREILVYIGKSTDMLKRISSHMANIDFDKSNKSHTNLFIFKVSSFIVSKYFLSLKVS